MRVQQIAGEPTRYYVESSALECSSCKKSFTRRELQHAQLAEEDCCPKCDGGVLQTKWHLVDLACFRPIGQCSCEHFSYRLLANVSKIPPNQLFKLTQGEAAKLRCSHIEAARALALDITVEQHERQRHTHAGRQAEGRGA